MNRPSLPLVFAASAAVVCLALTGCGPTSGAAGGSAATSGSAGPATSAAPPPAEKHVGGGTCSLITEQEASAALQAPSGKGDLQGNAAQSHCVWADGALAITLFANGKPEYDQLAARTEITGATATTWHKVDGLGGAGFVKFGGPLALDFFLHGTTLVNIVLSGPGVTARPDAAVIVARAAAARL